MPYNLSLKYTIAAVFFQSLFKGIFGIPPKKCYISRRPSPEREAITEFFKEQDMVKHIILWQLKENFSDAEKEEIKKGIKAGLEGLAGVIPGLISIKVNTGRLASSNADVMLDSSFEDEAALAGYAVHPAHQEVANTRVRPFTQTRLCLDFEA